MNELIAVPLFLLAIGAGIFLIPVLLNWDGHLPRFKKRRPRRRRPPKYDLRAVQAQKIRDRADREHARWLEGDDRGLYGQYPPEDL